MSQSTIHQAITTKTLPATDTRGTRITVRADGGYRKIYPWDYELNAFENHRAAMSQLCAELGWTGRYVGGSVYDGDYTFVRASK